jgi:glycosyltransferase involved in cell wall biosynthesis
MTDSTAGQVAHHKCEASNVEPAPNILHIAQSTNGGMQRYLIEVCSDQLARGWPVTVACPDGPLAADLRALGVSWRSWPATRSPGPATIRETLAVRRIIQSVAPDVVHLHSSKAGLAGRIAVRQRRPTIFQPHGWSWLAVTGRLKWLTVRWERFAARWTTVVVCVGHDEATAATTAGVQARMDVIRNGVNRAHFAPAGESGKRSARRELGVAPTAPLVVCAGRVTRQKGQDVLLAAWCFVRARCPDAQLAIVGDGDLLSELCRGASDGVRFVPTVADIRPWFAAADVVALPSRWEGLPLTALEAGAMGRPVVGCAVAGLIEIVTPQVGCLVPPENPAALADALARRLTEPALAQAEGRSAAARAEQFDQRHTLDELARLTVAVAARSCHTTIAATTSHATPTLEMPRNEHL